MTEDDCFEEFELLKEELIDEYTDGLMSSLDRRLFEEHFLTTPGRQLSLRLAQNLMSPSQSMMKQQPDITSVPKERQFSWLSFLFGTSLWTAASMVVVVAAALIGWNIFFRPASTLTEGLPALNEAYREQRPLEARVSGLQYAPWRNTRSGDEINYDRAARARAEALLHLAASKDPDAAAHHALGQLALMNRQFDDAIRELNEALKTDPKNAQIHSDLDAHMVRARPTPIAKWR